MNIANQFRGLPMADLIGAPLGAACKANVSMAQATASFIKEVGYEAVEDPNQPGSFIPGAPRMVDFSFERPGVDDAGKPAIEVVKIKVPILSVVPIPNLQVNNVDVTFDMEVKSSTSQTHKDSKEASMDASASFKFLFWSGSIKMHGAVSSSNENVRTSDKSAKYHVEVNAQNHGTPEGLARVLDILNQAATPRQIDRYQPDTDGDLPRDNNTGKPTGTATALDANGNVI